MKILLTISYDGTNYFGWQIQKDYLTVQKCVEDALKILYKNDIILYSASRTDAGVHALSQKAIFTVRNSLIPIQRLPKAINSYLPKDIIITDAEIVDDEFNPRYMAKCKTYQYKICVATYNNPLNRNYCYHFPRKLDIEIMKKCSQFLVGTHDFKSFCSTKGTTLTTLRTIYSIDINQDNITNILTINICGNGFLYNMVRIIVGTILEFGAKKINPSNMKEILLACDRTKAGKTVPPQGLVLLNIEY